MIVVAGEALVDLVPRDGGLVPLPGGSPFNVAVALGRLGVPTAFLGRCSTDAFGRALRGRLASEDVDLGLTVTADDPTTLAVVHLDDSGRAGYRFYLQGTSAAGLTASRLPALPPADPLHVSLGAVTLSTEPAGRALRGLIEREAPHRVVSFDPNVRTDVIGDPGAYARLVAEVVAQCALVKVSDEDLAVLHPDRDAIEVARHWAAAGPDLVVVTRGRDGALAVGASASVTVPAPDVVAVDTVGAGDAFTAGLLARLGGLGCLADRGALASATRPQLRDALEHAARVAAVTCTRPGADPPRAAEL